MANGMSYSHLVETPMTSVHGRVEPEPSDRTAGALTA